jgi:membrane-bound metal-dependent hydrolase YbcI (DUF457 family)
MLPPGHIAAGFLVGKALLKFIPLNFSELQQSQIILWTMFFSFAPDLDIFYSFFKEKAFVVKNLETNNHRKYLSHAPVLWLIVGLFIFFSFKSTFVKILGLSLWLGSWSHFLLDSIEYGIMWLWPINRKVYAFKDVELSQLIIETNFFDYWFYSVKQYTKSLTFYFEVFIIFISIAVYFY